MKKHKNVPKKIHVSNGDYFVSAGLQLTNRKIGKIVTIYRRELFKEIPRLGTFCTQSIKRRVTMEGNHNLDP